MFGASNRLPEGMEANPAIYKDIYVITSKKPVKCHTVSQKGLGSITFNPGDTVLLTEAGAESLRDLSLPGIPEDAVLKTIVVSLTPPVTALIPDDKLTHSGLRTEEDIEKEALKAQSKENYETVKSFMSGDQNFPFNPLYSLLAIVVAVIIASIIVKKGYEELDQDDSSARILTVISVVILILSFAFQFWVLHNGDIALNRAVKGNVSDSPMLSAVRIFGFGFGLFIFSIFEVSTMYSALHLIGELFKGRTSYKGTGMLIWGGGIIAGVIICFFFSHHLLTFAMIMIVLLALDFLFMLIINVRSIGALCLSVPLYAIGAVALTLSMIMGTVISVWLVLLVAAIMVFYAVVNPWQVVGQIYNGLGTVIGEVYRNGMGYIKGRGLISSDEVDRMR